MKTSPDPSSPSASPSPSASTRSSSSARPLLHHLPQSLPAQPSRPSPGTSSTSSLAAARLGASDATVTDARQQDRQGAAAPTARASPGEIEVDRLRQLQARMLQSQQRVRLRPSDDDPKRPPKVSPIREEPSDSLSPTLEASFSGPLPSAHTASTESSSRTIRGSVPPTPSGQPIRTPSYPFPIQPAGSSSWSSFHSSVAAPWLAMRAAHTKGVATQRERVASETSTPTASATPFAPGANPTDTPEDPRFPTPSLYDLTLLLGAEPGLAAWWHDVTIAVRDWYQAERATLAVPADPSDIENVPWGQKTTFDLAYLGEARHTSDDGKANSSSGSAHAAQGFVFPAHKSESPPRSATEKRPPLSTRHSYAGAERQRRPSPPEQGPSKPRGPLRAVSYASHGHREHPLRQMSPASLVGALGESSISDVEYSSIEVPVPFSAVFPILRALDREPDALIDNAGVNRVLERGRLVALTRDYAVTCETRKTTDSGEQSPKTQKHPSTAQAHVSFSTRTTKGRPSAAELSEVLQRRYEESEQYPTSPWAQSPVPSPAMQTDPVENPFFASVDEETFNPSDSAPNYSQYGQVEAIGVDRASTIIHIPLVHPKLSQPMHLKRSETRATPGQDPQSCPSPCEGSPRKAPIAILSILSPTVPYPQNLTASLKLLGPHLATSFSNAWQYTDAQAQASGHRRFPSGHRVSFAPTSDPEQLDDLLTADLVLMDTAGGGSVTSPSDYSSRSRHSPGNSIGGTPGWDPYASFSSRRSVGSTPAHLVSSEVAESYFDAKNKSPRPVASQSQAAKQETVQSERRAQRGSFGATESQDAPTPRSSRVRPQSSGSKPAAVPSIQPVPPSPRKQTASASHPTPAPPESRPHSLLHSYGADFTSSFQSLPAATTPGTHPPAPTRHGRSASATDAPEMPPPSERLLRIIIDSLPVQTFTARPGTGAPTWVNSKVLVYRGRRPRDVLKEPYEAIHPDDKDGYLEQWNKSLRTGQQLQQKIRLRRFDGHYRWFYVRATPLKDRHQQIVHWIGTNMDVHEHYLAEVNSARQQETAASEAKYRALANSSPQIVFTVSNLRGLTFCNSQWISYTGQTEVQALATGFLEHVHPDDIVKCKLPEMGEDGSTPVNVPTSMPTEHTQPGSLSPDAPSDTDKTVTSPGNTGDPMEMPQAKLSKLAGTGVLKVTKDVDGRASYSTEVRMRNKDGDYRWHLVRILFESAVLSSENSDDETWYGTATDINDHKLLEQTLKETMDAKSKFLSNMSHEIRTPLNGISGMVNFLLDSPLNTEQLEHVNIIKASTDSLLSLINDILDLSKVEAGMVKLAKDWLHLPSLLEEVNDLNMGLAIQKKLELNYIVEEDVPSTVKGDKFRIRQVLLNVVGNAIKFTQKGEVFVRCSLADRTSDLEDNETLIRFEVVDTGSGFSEKEAKFLFKRFSQIDASSTRQHGGSGLGLAISMQFVELHGGKMDARSVPGKGSTFFFTIQFKLPSDADAPPKGRSRAPAQAPEAGERASSPVSPSSRPKAAVAGPSADPKARVRITAKEEVKSPVASVSSAHDSPVLSSGSSDPSLHTGRSSLRSERSSASSFVPEPWLDKKVQIRLALPADRNDTESGSNTSASDETERPSPRPGTLSPDVVQPPPMYSILVVCPLEYSREATVRHIKMTLPKDVPHQITAQPSVSEAQCMIGGADPILFTHVVSVLHESHDVVALMELVFRSSSQASTSLLIICDPTQKKKIKKAAPDFGYDKLVADHRLHFVYRPLKPSKLSSIFDPQKQRESSTDRNQDSAQQVAFNQKLVFEDLRRRLGNKGHRVLLVEDNHINQTVGECRTFAARAERTDRLC